MGQDLGTGESVAQWYTVYCQSSKASGFTVCVYINDGIPSSSLYLDYFDGRYILKNSNLIEDNTQRK